MDAPLSAALELADKLPRVWMHMLFVMRYTGMMLIMPGLSGGMTGLYTRFPAILIFSMVAAAGQQTALPLPVNIGDMSLMLGSELLLGFVIGLIPFLFVAAVQTGGQLASTTMGLGAGALVDPTMGTTTSDISRITGDLVTILFMMVGGHYVIMYTLAGGEGYLPLGMLFVNDLNFDLLVNVSARVFELGVILAGPVIAAVMLSQVVLGILSRAVPTINLFIVSFPLTIGIGLAMWAILLPQMVTIVGSEVRGVEKHILQIGENARTGALVNHPGP